MWPTIKNKEIPAIFKVHCLVSQKMVCIIDKHTRKYTGEQHVTQTISCNNVCYNNKSEIRWVHRSHLNGWVDSIRDAPKWKFLAKTEKEETKAENRKPKHRKKLCQLLVSMHLWLWLCTNFTKIKALQLHKII